MARQTTRSARDGVIGLVLLYLLAVAVYALLGHDQRVPLIFPDEFKYGHLARSLADGQGFDWRGESVSYRAALYVYAIAPAYLTSSLTTAYSIAKLEGAMLVCLVVVPTWLLARPGLGGRLALVPAALSVAGIWMTSAAGLVTENLAYPLTCAALAATVAVVRAPGSRWGWWALGFGVLAAWARAQCAVAVPILALALWLSAAIATEGTAARLKRDRSLVAVSTVLSVTGLIVLLAWPAALGDYAGVGQTRPGIGEVLRAIGHQSAGLTALAGVLPALLVVAASLSRASWRDRELGPLLVVTWVASVSFVAQTGWYLTSFPGWHIERYVQYALPLLFVAALVAVHQGRVAPGRLLAVSSLVAASFLLSPKVQNILEERAVFGLNLRWQQVVGLGAGAALAATTLLVGGAAALAVGRRRAGTVAVTALLAVGCATALVLAVEDQAGWAWQRELARDWRSRLPADLSWIDHAGHGSTAALVVTPHMPVRWPLTEFFNRDVDQMDLPRGVADRLIYGRVCQWTPAPDGTLQITGDCATIPKRWFLGDNYSRVVFYRQHVEASDPESGRVVRVDGRPRLMVAVNVSCPRRQVAEPRRPIGPRSGRYGCTDGIDGRVWLDAPAVVRLRFRGDGADHTVAVNGTETRAIASQGITTVSIPMGAGSAAFAVDQDWRGASPALVSADLVQHGRVTPIH